MHRGVGTAVTTQSILESIIPESQPKDSFDQGSFAAIHDDCQAAWFVDGSQLFRAVSGALKSAMHQIMITDWMLSPEVSSPAIGSAVTVHSGAARST